MISTGNGLRFVIEANNDFPNDWMSFALFRSIMDTLPDAKTFIHFSKKPAEKQYFPWAYKLNLITHSLPEHFIPLEPSTVFLHNIDKRDAITLNRSKKKRPKFFSEAKSGEFTPFVSYKEGIGNFVLDRWIHIKESPFSHADKFAAHSMNMNEIKILRLWKRISQLYNFLNRW